MTVGLRRPRLIRQLQQTECALCCCAMLLRQHNRSASIDDLRQRYIVGRDGLNMANIVRILTEEGGVPHV